MRICAVALISALLVGQIDKLFAADAQQISSDEKLLKSVHLKTDGESLIEFFKRRTLDDQEQKRIAKLIDGLGAASYRGRSKAANELISRGPVVVEALQAALNQGDLEVRQRAEMCLRRIRQADYSVEIPAAAARLLADRKPDGALKALLAFVPFAADDSVADEVRRAMTELAIKEGKVAPALVEALTDKIPIRRATAGEAIPASGAKEHQPAVKKLLKDSSPLVRFRVSMALTYAEERQAVPVLIDVLPEVSLTQAWQAEDVLYRIAGKKNPPSISLGKTKEDRNKCRQAWVKWWKANGDKIDLAGLAKDPPLKGYTIVVHLDMHQVIELGRDNKPRWSIGELSLPLDVQMLGENRVLVAEYQGQRVTERNLKGEVLWEHRIPGGPLAAQRLENGNTFIVTDSVLYEVNKKGRYVFSSTMDSGERIMKGVKLRNGEMIVMTTGALTKGPRVARLSSKGRTLSSFELGVGARLFGGRIDVLPNGNVVVPHNAENKVVEYDSKGKAVWQVETAQPIAAVRLNNGNTIVTSMQPSEGAIEYDRHGKKVWQYTANTRVTRALRR